jgi:hypothetical protein
MNRHERRKCPECGDELVPAIEVTASGSREIPCSNCELLADIAIAFQEGRGLRISPPSLANLDLWRIRIYHLIRQRSGEEEI